MQRCLECYLVGGAVRDRLLGLAVKDRDYVVVGTTPEAMLALGYVPVGRDFPVFLHPHTHEEYALARTERKTAPGYKGFVFQAQPDVTLEQDLSRRDLTINAMAQAEDGIVIDPFNGQADLHARLLRHVSPAFLEDPVRLLRVARFSARFTDFSVAPATAQLMHAMVENGEVDALVPERAWQEFSRGLMEAAPSRMLQVLHNCTALERLLPAVAGLWSDWTREEAMLARLDAAADAGAILPVRFAILLCNAGTASIASACKQLKVPTDCRELAIMTAREADAVQKDNVSAEEAVALLERCDALRKPGRFGHMLEAAKFALHCQTRSSLLEECWLSRLHAALAVDAGSIATYVQQAHPNEPMRINAAIRAARIQAVSTANALL